MRGLERIAIVDWDVHHGNGTESIFYDDPSVLFVSLHQDDLYPADRGDTEDRGAGEGLGTTVNIPLPAGTGDKGYLYAFDEIVGPALEAFDPELLLVSAGQDAAASDPLGRMSVTTEGFRVDDRSRRRPRRRSSATAGSWSRSRAATASPTCPSATSRSPSRWPGCGRPSPTIRSSSTSRRRCAGRARRGGAEHWLALT